MDFYSVLSPEPSSELLVEGEPPSSRHLLSEAQSSSLLPTPQTEPFPTPAPPQLCQALRSGDSAGRSAGKRVSGVPAKPTVCGILDKARYGPALAQLLEALLAVSWQLQRAGRLNWKQINYINRVFLPFSASPVRMQQPSRVTRIAAAGQ